MPSGGKVILSAFNGNRVTISEVYRFSNNAILLGDHIYWDFLHLFEEVKKGLRLANKITNGQIASIGVDTWGIDCAFLDKQGHLIENPHSYRDARTDGMMEKAFQKMPREELYERTGVQFMQMNTIFQLLSMVEENPKAFEQVSSYLMVADLFNYYLTGKKFCEFTNATNNSIL